MVQMFGAKSVRSSLQKHDAWSRDLFVKLDAADLTHLTTWKKYDFAGPVFPLCPGDGLKQYGDGDEAKFVCNLNWLLELSGSCDIISIGSNGQWKFEETLFQQTSCRVHTFDCTGNYPAPAAISARVFSYRKCIGQRSGHSDYISYDEMLALAGIR